MTYEETISNLEYLISEDCVDTHHDYIQEIEMAIEALEKRIRKKPYVEFGFFCCKSCSCELNEEDDSYCHNCGQAIDWSDAG